MPSFRDLSLKHKLMLVLTITSFLVLMAAFLAVFAFERLSSQAALAQDLDSLGDVVAANSTAALTFEEARSAGEILTTLRLRPNIVTACLYTADGRPFATYLRKDARGESPPSSPPGDGNRFELGHRVLVRPVHHDSERVGTLFMKADTAEMDARLRRYGAALMVLIVLGGAGTLL